MNKLKGIILVVSICFASIMMPFNIYADSLPQSEIVGVSWNLIDTEISLSSGGNWYTYIYELEVKLKNKYVGVVDGTLSYTYSDVQSTSSTPTSKTSTTTKRNYVNGDSFKFNIYISNIGQQFTGNGPMYNCSYLINNSTTNVTKYEDLNSIESVVNVLSDIYQNSSDIEGLSTNQLAELQKIVQNTSLANEYLDIISQLRQYNIPIESVPFVYGTFQFQEPVDLFDYLYNYNYPVFSPKQNERVFQLNLNKVYEYDLIFISRAYSSNDFNNIFSYTSVQGGSFQFVSYQTLNTIFIKLNNINDYCYLNKAVVKTDVTGNFTFTANYNNYPFIPIYFNRTDYNYLSTDFALRFGLSNPLIEDVHTIANGTQASNNASQQLDSDTSDFNTDRDDLIDIEDTMGNNMDSAMNQITPNNNGLSGFGGNFLTSAVWVRTQFERLTNNTPYGSLIVYGLTLGLALLLLGKVML